MRDQKTIQKAADSRSRYEARMSEIDKERIYRILDGIREQVEKDHFWNAIARAQIDLMPELLRGFDYFLKSAGIRRGE